MVSDDIESVTSHDLQINSYILIFFLTQRAIALEPTREKHARQCDPSNRRNRTIRCATAKKTLAINEEGLCVV